MEDIFEFIKDKHYVNTDKKFKLSPVITGFENDETRRLLAKAITDHNRFVIYTYAYKTGDRIDKYSDRTVWLHNPDVIIGMDRKLFPELTNVNDELDSEIALFLHRDHIYTVIKITNTISKKFECFVWRFCPLEICYDKSSREKFLSIASLTKFKRLQGVTDDDKELLVSHFYSYEALELMKHATGRELKRKVFEEQYKLYGFMTDSIPTLPFYTLYMKMEQAFGYNESRCGFDQGLFIQRLKEGFRQEDNKLFDKFLLRDLDYCSACLKYTDH